MVRRPGDKTPDPPGGRASERLRMFEQARRPDPSQIPKVGKSTPTKSGGKKGKRSHANHAGRKD